MTQSKEEKQKNQTKQKKMILDSTKFNVLIVTSQPFSWFDELRTTYPQLHWIQINTSQPLTDEQKNLIKQLSIVGNPVIRYYRPQIQLCGTLAGAGSFNIPRSKIVYDLKARRAI